MRKKNNPTVRLTSLWIRYMCTSSHAFDTISSILRRDPGEPASVNMHASVIMLLTVISCNDWHMMLITDEWKTSTQFLQPAVIGLSLQN